MEKIKDKVALISIDDYRNVDMKSIFIVNKKDEKQAVKLLKDFQVGYYNDAYLGSNSTVIPMDYCFHDVLLNNKIEFEIIKAKIVKYEN